MFENLVTLKACLNLALIGIVIAFIKCLFFPHKYRAEPMSFDLRAVKQKPTDKEKPEVSCQAVATKK